MNDNALSNGSTSNTETSSGISIAPSSASPLFVSSLKNLASMVDDDNKEVTTAYVNNLFPCSHVNDDNTMNNALAKLLSQLPPHSSTIDVASTSSIRVSSASNGAHSSTDDPMTLLQMMMDNNDRVLSGAHKSFNITPTTEGCIISKADGNLITLSAEATSSR